MQHQSPLIYIKQWSILYTPWPTLNLYLFQELWHHSAGNSLLPLTLGNTAYFLKNMKKKKDLQSEKSIGNKWNQVSSLVVLHLVRIISYLFIIFSLKKCIVTVYLGIVTVHFLRLCETQSLQLIAENNLMYFSYCKC